MGCVYVIASGSTVRSITFFIRIYFRLDEDISYSTSNKFQENHVS